MMPDFSTRLRLRVDHPVTSPVVCGALCSRCHVTCCSLEGYSHGSPYGPESPHRCSWLTRTAFSTVQLHTFGCVLDSCSRLLESCQATNTTKTMRNATRTANTFMISHLFEDMLLRYFNSCA